ncbi:MAG: hypothetical protein FWG87_06670 [Defluviitaleaceae bacterium]|nr:hypothetical protein [Defluviitaleaceae bacterium]
MCKLNIDLADLRGLARGKIRVNLRESAKSAFNHLFKPKKLHAFAVHVFVAFIFIQGLLQYITIWYSTVWKITIVYSV